MSPWTMIFLLAIAGMLFSAWKHHHDVRLGVVRDEDGNPVFPPAAAPSGDVQRELTELRERVKVLERIATDEARPISLAHEIESLRDKD